MPKAAKKSRTSGSARADPLKQSSGNTLKKARSATEKSSEESSTQNTPVKDCQAGNYLLFVNLCGTYDPSITRLLSVPPELTFDKLHDVLQIAFGWTDSHMHTFRVEERDPVGQRRGENLLELSRFAQDDNFGFIRREVKAEAEFALTDVFENAKYRGKTTLTYEYDMGDSWKHDIYVLGRADDHLGNTLGLREDGDQRILCISGEGHGCAEDCGSYPGWEDLKEAFKKTKGGDKERREWYKKYCLNGDPKGLDPHNWSILDVNAQLSEVSKTICVEGLKVTKHCRLRSEDSVSVR